MAFARSISVLAVAAWTTTSLIAPARAELPPQFTTWADFAAVVSDSSIPHLLGVVEAIERTQAGNFIVRSKSCHVEVTVMREGAKDPDGRIIVGPSRITRVEVSGKHCER